MTSSIFDVLNDNITEGITLSVVNNPDEAATNLAICLVKLESKINALTYELLDIIDEDPASADQFRAQFLEELKSRRGTNREQIQ